MMHPSKQPPKPRDGVDDRKLNGQRDHPFQRVNKKRGQPRASSHLAFKLIVSLADALPRDDVAPQELEQLNKRGGRRRRGLRRTA